MGSFIGGVIGAVAFAAVLAGFGKFVLVIGVSAWLAVVIGRGVEALCEDVEAQ